MLMEAFSKINLILDVTGKRPDGYHNIRSIMQTISLSDTLTISAEECSQAPTFVLTCDEPTLPTDDRNLVTRAAKYMMEEYNIGYSIRIHLEKRIPQAAGLAGGSSNCAATLSGINKLFALNISARKLRSIGQTFGADVPFCLLGGTALAEGIGERLTSLPPHPHAWVVLACPDIRVSTKDIFRNYNPALSAPGNVKAMIDSIKKGDLQGIADNFSNDLTQVTVKIHPQINDLIYEMKAKGAINAAMSGSGPTVFGYFPNQALALKAHEDLKQHARTFLAEVKQK